MDWFKTKKTTTPLSPLSSPDHLLALVRTMEDDIAGRQVPTGVPIVPEPLVTFRPDATAGAPFFSAAEPISEAEAPVLSETSPFFQEAGVETLPAPAEAEVPMFDPPLPTAQPEASPEPEKQASDSESVAFTTNPESIVSSLRASIGNMASPKSLGTIFRDRKVRVISIVAASLLLVAIVAGLYFWWRSAEENGMTGGNPDVRVESPKMPETALRVEPVSQAKYFADQPNILSFDTETVTAEEIKSTLLQVGQSIKKDNLPGAVEFLVRDQKLNPLALARFAYLAKLSLPAELLGTLDEAFSLYVVIDAGRPRLVLLAYAKDEPAFAAELQRNEKNLAQAIDSLFLDVTTAPKNNLVFRDGAYLERPVRFANVDASIKLSVDYAVRGRQWIIGTSKDSLRAVLDKTGL